MDRKTTLAKRILVWITTLALAFIFMINGKPSIPPTPDKGDNRIGYACPIVAPTPKPDIKTTK